MRFGLIASAILIAGSISFARSIPKPLENHPGNIFVHGEEVRIDLPKDARGPWKLFDYEQKEVSNGAAAPGTVQLGKLPVGYYELKVEGSPRITLGVVAPLAEPTPDDSPISTDTAIAQFYHDPAQQRAAASLCALAGMNWTRDRLHWNEIELQKGKLQPMDVYDNSVRAQSEAGLHVLDVAHRAPPWATEAATRFPTDLRDPYNFYRQIAKRWKGKLLAFEPWNEADIDPFGPHTGCEIASMQKASYLGLKAGNPDIIACQNCFAADQPPILEDFRANEAWPYFDTYNFHHYAWFNEYDRIYDNHRATCAGRPMWVTECNIPVHWAGDPKLQEPTDSDLRVQASRVAKIYTNAISRGAVNVFYFILGDYVEGETQFGVIHKDLTPRPAYLAMAAAGRLLAGAKPIGEVHWEGAQAFAFSRSNGDGAGDAVIVAWADHPVKVNPPGKWRAFDLLGREIKATEELTLSDNPVYITLPSSAVHTLSVTAPPTPAPWKQGKPCPVVLQVVCPEKHVDRPTSAYWLDDDKPYTVQFVVYNFSEKPVTAKLTRKAQGLTAELPNTVELAPGERKILSLTVTVPKEPRIHTLKVVADAGNAGTAVISQRFVVGKSPPK